MRTSRLVVLAAGVGSRLQPKVRAKALVRVGGSRCSSTSCRRPRVALRRRLPRRRAAGGQEQESRSRSGLVVTESLATGTPVIARRDGVLPEIVEHGGDGYLVDDLSEAELAVRLLSALDRADIRRRTPQRFSAARMADDYERIYLRPLQRAAEPRVHIPAAASTVSALLPVGSAVQLLPSARGRRP